MTEGSYGRVSKLRDERVAVKVFQKDKYPIFLRELIVSKILSGSEHIINLVGYDLAKCEIRYELWDADLLYCISKGVGTDEENLQVFKEILIGVGNLHDYGLVHADIKSSNMMIRTSNNRLECCVIDFSLTSQTGSADIRLTTPPNSENPPLCNDWRHDMYSLGILAIELFGRIHFVSRPSHNTAIRSTSLIKNESIRRVALHMLDIDKSQRINCRQALSRAYGFQLPNSALVSVSTPVDVLSLILKYYPHASDSLKSELFLASQTMLESFHKGNRSTFRKNTKKLGTLLDNHEFICELLGYSLVNSEQIIPQE